MKFDRTKNASRNIFFGLIQRIYQIIVPFIMRTAMIYLLGVEYLGLDSLFTSILSVLNLAELGVGTAMVYNMYRPIAEDDRPTICALMRLYMIYYRIIGGIILVGGLILCPFVPNLISGSIPSELNIYILFLLNLSATVLSYWLFAYTVPRRGSMVPPALACSASLRPHPPLGDGPITRKNPAAGSAAGIFHE